MAKKNKTVELNKDFSFSNIKRAKNKENFKASNDDVIPEKSLKKIQGRTSYLLFGIDVSYKNKFISLYIDYKEITGFLKVKKEEFFYLCCDFLIEKYKNEGTFFEAKNSFIDYAFRSGRRATCDRTPLKNNVGNIRISVSQEYYKKYKDLSYTFVTMFHNNEFNKDFYSKGYFFYDFIDEIYKHRKDIFKIESL